MVKILGKFAEPVGIIVNLSENEIAAPAQEPTPLASDVVVVVSEVGALDL
jgi:hypothetical protein